MDHNSEVSAILRAMLEELRKNPEKTAEADAIEYALSIINYVQQNHL